MSDHLERVLLVKNRVDRLESESRRAAQAGDLDRLRTINEELELLVDSMHDIREEQLVEQIERRRREEPKPKRRERWWQFWRFAA